VRATSRWRSSTSTPQLVVPKNVEGADRNVGLEMAGPPGSGGRSLAPDGGLYGLGDDDCLEGDSTDDRLDLIVSVGGGRDTID
jgi:hypothetical protein